MMEHKRTFYDLLDVPDFPENEANDMRPSHGIIISAIIGGIIWTVFAIAALFAAGIFE